MDKATSQMIIKISPDLLKKLKDKAYADGRSLGNYIRFNLHRLIDDSSPILLSAQSVGVNSSINDIRVSFPKPRDGYEYVEFPAEPEFIKEANILSKNLDGKNRFDVLRKLKGINGTSDHVD